VLNSLGAHAVVAEEKVAFPLQLEVKIPLGDVRGRIDHMALDLKRQRLFVADLENDSIGVVDLASHHVVRTLSGLRKPQGVAYLAASDVVYVANAGDGSVRLFRGNDYAPIGRVDLGEDADNIRINAAGTRVMVGHNDGSLAVLDPSGRLVGNVPLKVHPEGFQIDDKSGHVLIDLPNDHSMVVVDDASLKQVARWSTGDLAANFPMALDQERRNVLVAFRRPARLGVFSIEDGSVVAATQICGDADDVSIDQRRRRAYVSCGEGFLDVLDIQSASYRRIAHIPTTVGARTSLFVPILDLLLLAAQTHAGPPSAVWVFRPISD
jgi:DNA-binding beta-propeller fold protein YncE